MTENERAARQKKISHAIMWIVLLVLFLCYFLTATARDKGHVFAVGIHLKVHCELLPLVVLKLFVFHNASLFKQFHLFRCELHVANTLAKVETAQWVVYQLVRLTVK